MKKVPMGKEGSAAQCRGQRSKTVLLKSQIAKSHVSIFKCKWGTLGVGPVVVVPFSTSIGLLGRRVSALRAHHVRTD